MLKPAQTTRSSLSTCNPAEILQTVWQCVCVSFFSGPSDDWQSVRLDLGLLRWFFHTGKFIIGERIDYFAKFSSFRTFQANPSDLVKPWSRDESEGWQCNQFNHTDGCKIHTVSQNSVGSGVFRHRENANAHWQTLGTCHGEPEGTQLLPWRQPSFAADAPKFSTVPAERGQPARARTPAASLHRIPEKYEQIFVFRRVLAELLPESLTQGLDDPKFPFGKQRRQIDGLPRFHLRIWRREGPRCQKLLLKQHDCDFVTWKPFETIQETPNNFYFKGVNSCLLALLFMVSSGTGDSNSPLTSFNDGRLRIIRRWISHYEAIYWWSTSRE